MKPLINVFGILIIFIATLCASCNDSDNTQGTDAVPPPPTIMYQVIGQHPHDTASFTQGLAMHDGKILESTGLHSYSWLGPLDVKTGRIDKKINLANEYFGEGITVLNGKIYHLTWQNKKGFIYDAATFKKIGEFQYPTEGWGLTSDSSRLIMSDGSSHLYFYDPSGFRLLKTLSVTDNYGPVPNINELEYINGYIYANQWQTPYILKIDTAEGKVIGRLDLQSIQKDLKAKHPYIDFSDMVLNGIAYDPQENKMYVTGKKWPALYEIKETP